MNHKSTMVLLVTDDTDSDHTMIPLPRLLVHLSTRSCRHCALT